MGRATLERASMMNNISLRVRRSMTLRCPLLILFLFFLVAFEPRIGLGQEQKLILVVGANGSSDYGKMFDQWTNGWEDAVKSGQQDTTENSTTIELTIVGRDSSEHPDRDQLKTAIEATGSDVKELWVVLIGHGTDDRKSSKFNLRGRDVSATELSQWLDQVACRVVVINCASASGGFITKLKKENRIVVTATRSGAQHFFARFGGYLAKAIVDPSLDLDKDQQTSLLEAFIGASDRTQAFYEQETRLATELAMIDDNSDGLGTPADWFQGTRVVRKSKKGQPDGLRANQIFLVRRNAEKQLSPSQREARDALESKLESLRLRKSKMTSEAYLQAIEPILLDLARIYEAVETAGDMTDDDKKAKSK